MPESKIPPHIKTSALKTAIEITKAYGHSQITQPAHTLKDVYETLLEIMMGEPAIKLPER